MRKCPIVKRLRGTARLQQEHLPDLPSVAMAAKVLDVLVIHAFPVLMPAQDRAVWLSFVLFLGAHVLAFIEISGSTCSNCEIQCRLLRRAQAELPVKHHRLDLTHAPWRLLQALTGIVLFQSR